MTLRELLDEVEGSVVTGDAGLEVRALSLDSRRVAAGDVFFALAGLHADGARFVDSAVEAGAAAVVTGPGVHVSGATHVEVADPRLALAQAANRLYGHPSRRLRVVAITGTNGKTTTTYLLESVFAAASLAAGVIGTTGIRIAGVTRPSAFTTPEAPQLQGLLAEMLASGVAAVAMEASSHALAQRRTWGLACEACVFTNLTQDHLDYHGTMAAYLDAKTMLFDGRNGGLEKPAVAVVNGDDPAAGAIAQAARQAGRTVVRFGEAAACELRIVEATPAPGGVAVRFAHEGATHAFTLPLLGRYNAWNAAGAWAAARAMGLPAAVVRRGLEACTGVPGRLERIAAGQAFTVAVDYAHTPDALERALAACREHVAGRLLVVFGCGGDRDRGKRPGMGGIAARMADRAWVTNDNPRGESPQAIADEIVRGAPAHALTVILDRRAAIAAALAEARPGDVVLVAGKGHESTQTIGSAVLPFDDRVVVRDLLTGGRA